MGKITRVLTITNEKGLHARASAKLVNVVESFKAKASARVRRGGDSAEGNSIMGLLMLGASRGTAITVITTGREAEALADAIEDLVRDRFGEGA